MRYVLVVALGLGLTGAACAAPVTLPTCPIPTPGLWQSLPVIARGTMTDVRALVSGDSIVLYYEAYGQTAGEDVVTAILDPAGDGRSPARFSLTREGRQTGKMPWTGEVWSQAGGWIAMMRIPFTSLPCEGVGTMCWSVGCVRGAPPQAPMADVWLTVPEPRPVLALTTGVRDTKTVRYTPSPHVSANLAVPDAAGVSPPFTGGLSVTAGEISGTVGLQRTDNDTQAATVGVGFSRPNEVSIGATVTTRTDATGAPAGETTAINTDVHLTRHWEMAARVAQADNTPSGDVSLKYHLTGPAQVSMTYTGSTVSLAGVLAPTQKTDVDWSYQALTNPVWRGRLLYRMSHQSSLSVGVSDFEHGSCNLYGTYRHSLPSHREMLVEVGDPSASSWSNRLLLKLVDHL